jgi:hypothetical protein
LGSVIHGCFRPSHRTPTTDSEDNDAVPNSGKTDADSAPKFVENEIVPWKDADDVPELVENFTDIADITSGVSILDFKSLYPSNPTPGDLIQYQDSDEDDVPELVENFDRTNFSRVPVLTYDDVPELVENFVEFADRRVCTHPSHDHAFPGGYVMGVIRPGSETLPVYVNEIAPWTDVEITNPSESSS